jgi:hypothetical protein
MCKCFCEVGFEAWRMIGSMRIFMVLELCLFGSVLLDLGVFLFFWIWGGQG